MDLREGVMIIEGERAEAGEHQEVGELDSFTRIVSEISRTQVAVCRKGNFRPRRRGESGEGTVKEHAVTFERKSSTPSCM